LVLVDQIRGKWDFPDLVKHTTDFLAKHRRILPGITPVTEAWVEDRASGTSLVQTLRRYGLPFKQWLPPHHDQKLLDGSQVLSGPDKVSRVKQSSMTIKAGRVFLPWPNLDGKRWVENLVNECSAFSNDDSHLYDDQVDGMTMANLIWQQRGGGSGPLPVFTSNSWQDWINRERI
jgi:predicted phage terminase large subunit-like protein